MKTTRLYKATVVRKDYGAGADIEKDDPRCVRTWGMTVESEDKPADRTIVEQVVTEYKWEIVEDE